MKYVLFVCNHNAGRSQMAQAFFERHAPDDIRAESAGSQPGRHVWPEVVEVMAEAGFDLSDRKPRKLVREMQLHADWAVTMGCGDACPYVPTTVEDSPIQPVARSRRSAPSATRSRSGCAISSSSASTPSAPTAPRTRRASSSCSRSWPTSSRESARPGEIRACADAVLARFDDVPVRSHVQTLGLRQTQECLRKKRCDVLAVV